MHVFSIGIDYSDAEPRRTAGSFSWLPLQVLFCLLLSILLSGFASRYLSLLCADSAHALAREGEKMCARRAPRCVQRSVQSIRQAALPSALALSSSAFPLLPS
jgi:hypothetical protein